MKVLVTGATGFIGIRLVQQLRTDNIAVKVLTRQAVLPIWMSDKGITVVQGDIADAHSVSRACDDVEYVFHLAGYAHAEDDTDTAAQHQHVTVDGTRTLLRCAVEHGIRRMVFASSVKAVCEATEDCIDELTPPRPSTQYGRAKRTAEEMVLRAENGIFRASILRLPLVYGPGVKGNLQRMMRMIALGGLPPLPRINNRRSMVHVDDAARALRALAQTPSTAGEVYFVSDGQIYTTREIYEAMRAGLGLPPQVWNLPRLVWQFAALYGTLVQRTTGRRVGIDIAAWRKLVASHCVRTDKFVRDTGFVPSQSLYDALPSIVARFRQEANRVAISSRSY